jgi:hypothetical protein
LATVEGSAETIQLLPMFQLQLKWKLLTSKAPWGRRSNPLWDFSITQLQSH